jgi:WD40 repeat protein
MSYSAFISYSHTSDSAIASALQSALHRFAKPWYKLRALHIFRDQTNLAVNPALWSSIRDALDQSSFFILLASPEAAASPWVAKEAEYWMSRNGPSHILLVLTGGTLQWDGSTASFTSDPSNALPPGLRHAFPEEPLFLDLRWARDEAAHLRLREPRFHEAVLQLASTLHNRPKDELDGADIRMQRETRWFAGSAIIALVLIALFALIQTRGKRSESSHNLAVRLASTSSKLLTDNPDQVREAALLAIESTRVSPSFEGNQALRSALALLPAGSQFYAPRDSDPAERIRDMAFSPDGALLSVARDDGSTQVINVATHQPVGFFMPDEQPLAHIEVTGGDSASLDNDSAVSVAFNSNGSLLASGGRDGVAHVWALSGGRELLRVQHTAPVSQIAFRPGANQVIIASDDGHVRIFDVARAAVLADFKCPDKVVSASFSPDGTLVAALSSDGSVSLFDPMHGKLLRTLPGGEAAFNLVFSNDGKRVAAAGGDFAFVWDVTSGKQLLKATHAASSETLTPAEWILNAAISADGKFLAYAARGDQSAHVWNIDTGRQILELKHSSAVAAVAFSADGTKLGTGSYDGTARAWEFPSGRELERASHAGGAEVVAFGPVGDRFAAGGVDGSVSVSETRRGDRPASFNLPSDVRSVAFSPDGRRAVMGTLSTHSSPFLKIADISGKVVRDIEFHGAPVIDKVFFLNSNEVMAQWSDKLFLAAIDTGTVTPLPDAPGEKRIDPSGKIFAIQRDGINKLYTLPGFQLSASLTSPVATGPPATLLRTAGEGKLLAFEISQPPNAFFIEIWSVADKARVARIQLPAELSHLAFNASATVLFTAENESMQAWEIRSGKQLLSITTDSEIEAIVPDLSSADFATINHGRLTVWDAVTGTRLGQLPEAGYLRAAAFSPDGRYLLAGYDERFAALWLWRAADLREQACTRITRNLSHDEWARWLPQQPYRQVCPNLPGVN